MNSGSSNPQGLCFRYNTLSNLPFTQKSTSSRLFPMTSLSSGYWLWEKLSVQLRSGHGLCLRPLSLGFGFSFCLCFGLSLGLGLLPPQSQLEQVWLASHNPDQLPAGILQAVYDENYLACALETDASLSGFPIVLQARCEPCEPVGSSSWGPTFWWSNELFPADDVGNAAADGQHASAAAAEYG